MCKELHQRWTGCNCWGFIRVAPCERLFRGCFGPGGDEDKQVVHWNDGMCGDCWGRLVAEAREQAAEAKRADREADELAAASVSSRSESTPSSSAWSR